MSVKTKNPLHILYIIDHYRILMHIGLNWPYMFCFIQSCWHFPCKTRPWNSRNVNQKGASAGSPEIRPKGRIQVHYMGRSTYVYYILIYTVYIYTCDILFCIYSVITYVILYVYIIYSLLYLLMSIIYHINIILSTIYYTVYHTIYYIYSTIYILYYKLSYNILYIILID